MRRLAVVGTTGRDAVALAHLRGWVSSLPSAGVAWLDRLAGLPLDHVDLIWLREPVAPDSRLQPWLHAGGRLLATHDAVGVVSSLGLESQLPATLSLPDPPLPDYGLAGFGAHPLFTGLRDGALLGASRHGGRVRCYDEWPEAAVVAVERRGFEVNAGHVLAWEYPVGVGGVLCLGLEPALGAAPGASGDAEVMLANALVGDAIPHRDRVTMAARWPRPGRRAVGAVADHTVVLFLPPSDVWPPSSQPALDLTPAADWTHAGRRLLIRGRAAIGDREVWAPPFRVMHAAAVRDTIACAPGHIAADEVAGGLAVGGYRLQERWLAAADAPVAVWEIAGRDGINVTLDWSVDLRRAWPYPLGSYGDLTFVVGTDHRGLRVQSEGGPRACYAVSGGTLAATPIPGHATIQVTCVGTTPVRIVTAAGIDGEELARALKALEHGVQELAAVRARKAAQLERHGTAFDPPDDLLARGFSWARQRGDEALVGAPGIGRSVLTGCPRSADDGAWCFGAQACAAAAAQLIAGDRDPARELLKFLAQSQRPDGGVPAQLPIGGLGSPPDAPSTAAFLRLAERVLAWTGDLDAFRRLRGAVAGAVTYLAATPREEPGLTARVLDGIEPLVDGSAAAAALDALRRRGRADHPSAEVEPHAVVEAAAASLRRAPGALVGSDAAPALLEAVGALWGLEPDASDGALALAPVVPKGWDGHALRGLRVGRSVLDLDVRRRPRALVVRVAHRFGPRLVLTIRAGALAVETTEVDDVVLPGGRARFETHDRHEVRFHLAG